MLPYSSRKPEGSGLLVKSSEVDCLCRAGREINEDLFTPGSVDAMLLVVLPVGRLKRSSLTSVAALGEFSRTCLHYRTLVHNIVPDLVHIIHTFRDLPAAPVENSHLPPQGLRIV
jgi:hypothetical protein